MTGPDLLMPIASLKLPMPPAPPGLSAGSILGGKCRESSARVMDFTVFHDFSFGGPPRSSQPPPPLAQSESERCEDRGQWEPEVSDCWETLPRERCSPHESEPEQCDDGILSDAVPVLCSLIGEGKCHGELLRPFAQLCALGSVPPEPAAAGWPAYAERVDGAEP
mmetsp:Transcript_73946/g.186362  ORF Transcript_73946/g.186362 Transcript_73946/m.186362 type:complete len:165 (-) Transcript_73946:1104-1598(-)